jgi:hypothetical protein
MRIRNDEAGNEEAGLTGVDEVRPECWKSRATPISLTPPPEGKGSFERRIASFTLKRLTLLGAIS